MESSTNKKYYAFSLLGVILTCIYIANLGFHSLRIISSFRPPIHAIFRSFILPFTFQLLFTTILIFIFISVSKNKIDKGVLRQYKVLNIITFMVGLFIIVPNVNTFIFIGIRQGFGPGLGYLLAQQFYMLFFLLTIGTNCLFKSTFPYKTFFALSILSWFLHILLMFSHIPLTILINQDLIHLLMLIIQPTAFICFYIANEWFKRCEEC